MTYLARNKTKDFPGKSVKVWLNGDEVTNDCTAFNSVDGWAEVKLRDSETGKIALDAEGKCMKVVKFGTVTFQAE